MTQVKASGRDKRYYLLPVTHKEHLKAPECGLSLSWLSHELAG